MTPKWMGKCPDCGTWDSLEEVAKATEDPHRPRALTVGRVGGPGDGDSSGEGGGEVGEGQSIGRMPASRGFAELMAESVPVAIADVPPLEVPRMATGISELDRVLGGGVVPGSAILLG